MNGGMNTATETALALSELTESMLKAANSADWALVTDLDRQRLETLEAFKRQKIDNTVDKEVIGRLRLLDERLRSTACTARDDVADKLRSLRQQDSARDAYRTHAANGS